MITDTAGNPVYNFSLSLPVSTSQIFTCKIDCETDYEVSADTITGVAVEAKRAADSSWVDIATTPIDLSTWTGTQQEFQFRITAGASPLAPQPFSIRVRHV